MLIFLKRSPTGDDPYLEWRALLMSIGAALGLAGMILDVSWLILAALVVLMAGIGLKHVPSRQDEAESRDA